MMNCEKCEKRLEIFPYLVKDIVDQDIKAIALRVTEHMEKLHGCTDHARISHHCKDCSTE